MAETIQRIVNKEDQEQVPVWKKAGALLHEHLFRKPGVLMLDVDGVFLRSDSLERPRCTTPTIVDVHRQFEKLGGSIGLATARPEHVVSFLRNQGLRLDGPFILEGGHVVIAHGRKMILASPSHMMFISHLREHIRHEPFFRNTWDEVQQEPGDTVVCHGDIQWNGNYRATLWYSWLGEGWLGERDNEVQDVVTPKIRDIALASGLAPVDYDIRLSRMDNGLGIIRIAAKIGGSVVTKEMAARPIWNGFDPVFVGDGPDDNGFGQDIRRRQRGMVIALGGSHDLTPEVPVFLSDADACLSGPVEYERALMYAMELMV